MPHKFDRSQILRTASDHDLGATLEGLAAEFAILGYISISCSLISLLNKNTSLVPRNAAFRKALWLVWDLTGVWPEGENASPEDVIELKEQYEGNSWSLAEFKEEGEHLYDETRLRKCVEKLREFEESGAYAVDSSTGWMAMRKGAVLVKALEIAVVLKGQGNFHAGKGLPDPEEILGWISGRLHANQMIVYLTQSEKTWGLLKDGGLAKAVGVKNEKVQDLGERVLETFKLRFENGVQKSEMWDKSVKELAQIISHNTVVNPASIDCRGERYGSEVEMEESERLTTILKDPLPRSEITALEKRLEVALPDDYKEFLAATNGMGPSWGGVITDTPLVPASEIRWITVEEDYFTDLAADFVPDIFHVLYTTHEDEWPTVGRTLEIGSEDIDNVWLLPPAKVQELVSHYLGLRGHSGETNQTIESAATAWAGSVADFEKLDWCVMTWAAGGSATMESYPSFKAFLVHKADSSADDTYRSGENPETVCFSYSCR